MASRLHPTPKYMITMVLSGYRSIRNYYWKLITCVLLLPVFQFISCEQPKEESIYDSVLHDVSRDSVFSWQDLRGRPVLIEFWSSWCSPCVASIAKLNRIYESFGADMSILFVNPSEDRRTVMDFLVERRIEATVLLDKEQRLYSLLGEPTLGTAFLYNRDGKLMWSGPLYFLEEKLIHAALEGRSIESETAGKPRVGLTFDIAASSGREESSTSVLYDGLQCENTFQSLPLSSVLITLLSQRYYCSPKDIKERCKPYGPYINLKARNQGGLPLEDYLDGIIGALQRMFSVEIIVAEQNGTRSITIDYSHIRCPDGFKYYQSMDSDRDTLQTL
jgi:thiol-disulfide isomerase/thioredoxin